MRHLSHLPARRRRHHRPHRRTLAQAQAPAVQILRVPAAIRARVAGVKAAVLQTRILLTPGVVGLLSVEKKGGPLRRPVTALLHHVPQNLLLVVVGDLVLENGG